MRQKLGQGVSGKKSFPALPFPWDGARHESGYTIAPNRCKSVWCASHNTYHECNGKAGSTSIETGSARRYLPFNSLLHPFVEDQLLADHFKSEVYARIYANRIALRLVRKDRNLETFSEQPFTSRRLLVGDFTTAEKLLADSVKELVGRSWFALSPSILVHPVEMVDGGLSQVEERVFLELGYGARGRKVKVYVGPELNDQAVIDKLDER